MIRKNYFRKCDVILLQALPLTEVTKHGFKMDKNPIKKTEEINPEKFDILSMHIFSSCRRVVKIYHLATFISMINLDDK